MEELCQSNIIKIFKQYRRHGSNSSPLRVYLRELIVVLSKVNYDLLLAFINIKSLDTTDSIDDDLLLAVLLHNAGVDQVAHQLGTPSIVLCPLFSIYNSVPQVG